ncbi:hypothetical protein EYC80_002731 [Monilinia laxa]|uniref:Uncharacterized protein n=1 Tax=Monilinia laxa TaxID=61186 RepID=A0A5N6K4T2_MONLA|nr:hypothetical protein EYC80_002731 [Monilinia laxa]
MFTCLCRLFVDLLFDLIQLNSTQLNSTQLNPTQSNSNSTWRPRLHLLGLSIIRSFDSQLSIPNSQFPISILPIN